MSLSQSSNNYNSSNKYWCNHNSSSILWCSNNSRFFSPCSNHQWYRTVLNYSLIKCKDFFSEINKLMRNSTKKRDLLTQTKDQSTSLPWSQPQALREKRKLLNILKILYLRPSWGEVLGTRKDFQQWTKKSNSLRLKMQRKASWRNRARCFRTNYNISEKINMTWSEVSISF